jgi:cobalt/nickel transport system permease protein
MKGARQIKRTVAGIYALEQLSAGKSAIHRAHPLVKLAVTLVYIVAVVSFGPYALTGLVPYLFYPFMLMAISETPYKPLLKRLLLALPFSVLAGVSNIIFNTRPCFMLADVAVSCGVVSFAAILLKTYLTVMALLILMSTTSMTALSDQLLRLKVPAIIVMLLSMVYRYISVLYGEASKMYTAYMLRARDQKGIRMRDMGSFVGQLLLRSVSRAERVYAAMKLRGYSGGMMSGKARRPQAKEIAVAAALAAAIFALRFVDVTVLLGAYFV